MSTWEERMAARATAAAAERQRIADWEAAVEAERDRVDFLAEHGEHHGSSELPGLDVDPHCRECWHWGPWPGRPGIFSWSMACQGQCDHAHHEHEIALAAAPSARVDGFRFNGVAAEGDGSYFRDVLDAEPEGTWAASGASSGDYVHHSDLRVRFTVQRGTAAGSMLIVDVVSSYTARLPFLTDDRGNLWVRDRSATGNKNDFRLTRFVCWPALGLLAGDGINVVTHEVVKELNAFVYELTAEVCQRMALMQRLARGINEIVTRPVLLG